MRAMGERALLRQVSGGVAREVVGAVSPTELCRIRREGAFLAEE